MPSRAGSIAHTRTRSFSPSTSGIYSRAGCPVPFHPGGKAAAAVHVGPFHIQATHHASRAFFAGPADFFRALQHAFQRDVVVEGGQHRGFPMPQKMLGAGEGILMEGPEPGAMAVDIDQAGRGLLSLRVKDILTAVQLHLLLPSRAHNPAVPESDAAVPDDAVFITSFALVIAFIAFIPFFIC